MPAAGVPKERLDRILVLRGLAPSGARAQAIILAGRVFSEARRLDKPGTRHPVDLPLVIQEGRRHVGRGALKLESALPAFGIAPGGRDALDVGASTGGFTQVLLESGAARVISLDVGRGQLDWGLRNDTRVHPMEGVNARHLSPDTLPFAPSLAVIDVSFISLELVLPPVMACLPDEGELVALIKPQFEVGKRQVGKGGIVRDPALHRQVLEKVTRFARLHGWAVRGILCSPITGADGNREFLIHLGATGQGLAPEEVERRLSAALKETAR